MPNRENFLKAILNKILSGLLSITVIGMGTNVYSRLDAEKFGNLGEYIELLKEQHIVTNRLVFSLLLMRQRTSGIFLNSY